MGKKQLKLGAFFNFPGHNSGAWRHSSTTREQELNIDFAIEQARLAETAKFDMVFLADKVAFANHFDQAFSQGGLSSFEPLTLLSALAVTTSKIGLIGTASTTFNEPYNLARRFASLDHISKGRAGWNVVTSYSPAETKNFVNQDLLAHKKRYQRAEEFVDVVNKLWDSWEDDALIYDVENELYADPSKIHQINHNGEWFNCEGPLNIQRSLQGRPVVVQAGASDDGRELAAKTAEVVFTAAQNIEQAQEFYRDVKSRMKKYGRNPDELKVMPGICPTVGRTKEEARLKHESLIKVIPEASGVARLSNHIGIDLSQYPIDGPLPDLPSVEKVEGAKSRYQILRELADRENLTIRQLYERTAGGRGHLELYGTATEIADLMQEWLENDGADGFNVLPPTYPEGFHDFIELVIPELQRRGIFRIEYEGNTLRENLGLSKPENIHMKNKLLDNLVIKG